MKTTEKDIIFKQGDSYNLKITIETEITNITDIFFTVKDMFENVKIQKILNNGLIYDKENKIILITLKPKDTDDLCYNYNYNYDVQINYNEDDKATILEGKMFLTKPITLPENEVKT